MTIPAEDELAAAIAVAVTSATERTAELYAKVYQVLRKEGRPIPQNDMVDQATICFTLGLSVHLVPGNRGKLKITPPEDIVTLEALLKWREGHV